VFHGLSTLPMADHQQFGVYGLLFYQLPWLDLRPYVMVEYFNPNDNVDWDTAVSFSGGLNYRPVPRVVLKLEYWHSTFPVTPDFTMDQERQADIERGVRVLSGQVALSF
jgi:hypothetical protein